MRFDCVGAAEPQATNIFFFSSLHILHTRKHTHTQLQTKRKTTPNQTCFETIHSLAFWGVATNMFLYIHTHNASHLCGIYGLSHAIIINSFWFCVASRAKILFSARLPAKCKIYEPYNKYILYVYTIIRRIKWFFSVINICMLCAYVCKTNKKSVC